MTIRSKTLEEGLGAETEDEACDDNVSECDQRRATLLARLRSVELPQLMEKYPAPRKIETHRKLLYVAAPSANHRAGDVLLKEMAWMASDFETERKRHSVLRKKRCKGIIQYFRNLEGCAI